VIAWQYFPKSDDIPQHLRAVIRIFETRQHEISSDSHELSSNEVLAVLQDDLSHHFRVEKSKRVVDKIRVPVLFGRNGNIDKAFDADAFDELTGTVIEVEAGRAVVNYQFLKDLFEACMMHDVYYLVIAVRNVYHGNQDFNTVLTFFDTMYASRRLELPLKGILVVGY